MFRTSFALLAMLSFSVFAVAAEPSPDPKTLEVSQADLSKAKELVKQLGSERFTEREKAENELAIMGRLGRAALLEGANTDPDPEIRARCRFLLPKATAAEMKARLDTFLADKDGKFEHNLPGWNQLRNVVRGEWRMLGWNYVARPNADKAARELFVEFLKTPGGEQMLHTIATAPSELSSLVAARKQELYNMRFGRPPAIVQRIPTAMEVAVVLFGDTQVGKNSGRVPVFQTVLSTSGIMQTAQGNDEKSKAVKAILFSWFETRTDPIEIYSAMNLANNGGNTEVATRLAMKLLNTSGATGFYRGQAITVLSKLPKQEFLPLIEKFIGDESVITTLSTSVNGKIVRTTIHMGDIALACAVVASGQKLEDYHIEDRFKNSPNAAISYTRYLLPDDKKKEAAAKWKEWREKNP
jgi:hypothetical protein